MDEMDHLTNGFPSTGHANDFEWILESAYASIRPEGKEPLVGIVFSVKDATRCFVTTIQDAKKIARFLMEMADELEAT